MKLTTKVCLLSVPCLPYIYVCMCIYIYLVRNWADVTQDLHKTHFHLEQQEPVLDDRTFQMTTCPKVKAVNLSTYLLIYFLLELKLFKINCFGSITGLWHEVKFSALILYTMPLCCIHQRLKILPGLFRNTLTLYCGTIEVEVPILLAPL